MRRSSAMRLFGAFGAVFVAIGIASAGFAAALPVWRARASLSWDETRCRIQRSGIESSDDGERAVVQYTYKVRGRQLSADRVDFGLHGWSTFALPPAHGVGDDVTCWYDPADPGAATLSRSLPVTLWWLFPLGFGGVGFLILRIGARSRKDDAPGTTAADGRRIYARRGSSAWIVAVIATMWLVLAGIFVLAIAVATRDFLAVIGASTAVATWFVVYELRCLACRVTVAVPSRLHRDDTARVDWQVRSLRGTAPSTASLIAVATTSQTATSGELEWSIKWSGKWSIEGSSAVTIETVRTVPIAQDRRQPGSGRLRLPDDAPVSTSERQIDWFVQVDVDLPPGPRVKVRVPIEL